VTRKISDAFQSFCEDCVGNQVSFFDHVLKHPNLPFATDNEENTNNLKKVTGKKFTAETHSKMSKLVTGMTVTAETCAKMSKSATGKTMTAETCAKISK
jgi:hypothetical protein